MADNYLSGLTGSVLVNGVSYSFGRWKLTMETNQIPRNNFTVQGFQRLVNGFTKGTLELQAPYNAGNMPLASGGQYTFTCNFTNTLGIAVVANVHQLEPDNDAEGAPNVRVVAMTTGTFTAAIS